MRHNLCRNVTFQMSQLLKLFKKVGSAVFADPHPISEEEEDTPFYKKGKSPIISSPAGGETIDKLRLEGMSRKRKLILQSCSFQTPSLKKMKTRPEMPNKFKKSQK